MKKLILILFLPLLFLSKNTFATHLAGSEITYKCIDTLKYEVTLTWYRDCRGIPLNNGGILAISCNGGGVIAYDTLSLISIGDITPVCKSVSSPCNPQNTSSNEGIEKHIYRDTIDFNSSRLSYLKSCSGRIILGASLNSRNGSITTGPSGTLYNDAEIDLNKAPQNSSPQLTSIAYGILCCFQPVRYSIGAIDTLDDDSLSYSFARPRSAFLTNTLYSSSFSYNNPLTVYYPGSLKAPYYNINANPPIGIYLDPLNGDLIFTPTNCSETTVLVIKVTEWRKDTSGNYQNIGEVKRDMQFSVKSCPDNNPPTINGPFSYNVCEGSTLCFNVGTDDKVFVPPPPASPPSPDSTQLEWNNGIPSASFTVINPTARLKTGRFCWTPPIGSASSMPYKFTVFAKDNACPINGVSSRSFQVSVKKRAKDSVSISEYEPGKYKVQALIDSSAFQGTESYQWTVLDTNMNLILNPLVATFTSTNSFLSRNALDTLCFMRNGTFIIQHDLNNLPLNCPITYYDTIEVDSVFVSLIQYPKDTTICAGSQVRLSTVSRYNSGPISYQWYKNDSVVLMNDTLPTLTFTYNERNANNTYSMKVQDSSGHQNMDVVRIQSANNIVNSLQGEYHKCMGDSVQLEVDTLYFNIQWNDGSLKSKRVFSQSANYTLTYQDTFGCQYLDSLSINIHPLPIPHLEDSVSCEESIRVTPGSFKNYLWSDSSASEYLDITSTGQMGIKVTDENGCSGVDSAYYTIHNAPKVSLGNDTTFCGDSIVLEANISGQYLWSSSEVSASIVAQNTGTYWLQVTDTNVCISRDSIEVNINSIPQLNLGNDTAFCGDSLLLVALQGYNYTWSNGDTLSYASINSSGDYWLQITDSNGCQSAADTIRITLHSNLATPVITQYGDSIGSSLTGKHIWFKDQNELVGEENNFLRITTDASYVAIHVDSNGCYSDTSNTLLATLSSRTLDHSRVKVYPNPSHGKLTIDLRLLPNVHSIYMLDALGRKVPLSQSKNGHLVQLEWNATAGILWLMIDAESGLYRKEIVYLK